jgi:hypothetical protein
MRKAISIFLCSLILLFQAQFVWAQEPINHGGKVETKYDGFALETVARLHKMKVTCSGFMDNFKDGCVSIDIALHCPGRQLSHVGSVTMQLIFETKTPQSHAPDQRDLAIVWDATKIKLGRMRLVSSKDPWLQEKTVETLEVTFPYGVFKRMVSAQSVEMQVGPSTIALREKNLLALRDLYNRILK